MQRSDWERVVADGFRVPQNAALDELTTELVVMLGDPDPRVRDDLAYSVLAAWVIEGVYDDLLAGLGDGLTIGMRAGLGDDGTDSVLRRSFSAVALAAVIARDNVTHGLHPSVVLTWADRFVAWFLGERDLRGWIPGRGWAHAGAHGADLYGALTASRYLGADELTVLLDVLAERLLAPTQHRFVAGEPDRLAFAAMSLIHRDLVSVDALEAWLDRIAPALADPPSTGVPEPAERSNMLGFVRALHLQLLLGVRGTPAQDAAGSTGRPPAVRADLLIALQGLLRASTPWLNRQA